MEVVENTVEDAYELPNDAKKYLESGEQTEVTQEIEKLVSDIHGTTEEKVTQLLNGMARNSERRNFNEAEFRRRTAKEIIDSRYYTGCGDFALVFTTLARATGIPTIYVETIDEKWLERGDTRFSGHAYAKVYDQETKGWIWVDPMRREIGKSPEVRERVILAEGKDAWDLGIRDFKTLQEAFREYRGKWLLEKQKITTV